MKIGLCFVFFGIVKPPILTTECLPETHGWQWEKYDSFGDMQLILHIESCVTRIAKGYSTPKKPNSILTF